MFLAATTGTSATERVEAMVRNAIYGIVAAKACGISKPTIGIANIDGARQTEKILKKLAEQGYEISFAESARADGGVVMRGNDLLEGTADVMDHGRADRKSHDENFSALHHRWSV